MSRRPEFLQNVEDRLGACGTHPHAILRSRGGRRRSEEKVSKDLQDFLLALGIKRFEVGLQRGKFQFQGSSRSSLSSMMGRLLRGVGGDPTKCRREQGPPSQLRGVGVLVRRRICGKGEYQHGNSSEADGEAPISVCGSFLLSCGRASPPGLLR